MKIAIPQDINDANLTSNVAMDDEPAWTAGSYDVSERVLFDRQIWQATTTTTDQPDVGALKDPATWVRLGWSNRWRMFNDGVDSQTSNLDNIDVTITGVGFNNLVAALGLEAFEVTMQVIDGSSVEYEETVLLTDFLVDNTWDWFFKPYDMQEEAVFNIPVGYTNADIRLLIDGFEETDTVKCGRVIMGRSSELGVTLRGTSVSSLSYSRKERDGFGNLIVVPRRTVKLVDYVVYTDTLRVSNVRSTLSKLDTTPTLFIGTETARFGATIVFGIIQDYRLTYSTPSISDMTITVEGF